MTVVPVQPQLMPARLGKYAHLKHATYTFIGVLHLCLTLYGSTRFLVTSSTSLTNDFLWANFNVTNGAVFVARAFSLMLRGSGNSTFQLSDDAFAMFDPVARRSTSTFSPTYARMLHYHRFTAVEDGITGVRGSNGLNIPFVVTQYCWVDFKRRWSLAHTARRAERCLETQQVNGAVYLESVLRNINWIAFQDAWGVEFTAGIGKALQQTEEGMEFLHSMTNHTLLSVANEAKHWRNQGIERFVLQYNNAWDIGVEEKIDVINAFGVRFPFTIKRREPSGRWAAQTTMKMYWTFASDLWAVVDNHTRAFGYTLVREAPDFYGHANLTMEQLLFEDGDVPLPLSVQDELFRGAVGPFNSIDLFWIGYPNELFELMLDVRRMVLHQVRTNVTAENAFLRLGNSPVTTSVAPVVWLRDWSLVGGSPLCSKGQAVKYIASQFGFDDTCSATYEEEVSMDAMSAIFIVLASNLDFNQASVSNATCALIAKSSICTDHLQPASAFITQFLPPKEVARLQATAAQVGATIAAMNISIIQFAKRSRADNTTEQTMLHQPLLTADANSTKPSWDVFGWLYLYEWAWSGTREVVSFQGDHGTLLLMSARHQTTTLVPNAAEIPQTASVYLLLAIQYVTLVLVVVATVVIMYAAIHRFRIAGLNLVAFNRVAGVVWVGRPLLFLRGVVTLGILSSARIRTTTPGVSVSWMTEDPQNWLTSIITAGEATWLLYVAVDVCLVFASGVTYAFAPLASIVVWGAIAILQFSAPVTHRAVTSPSCVIAGLDTQVICVAGSIYIGNVKRLATTVVIILVAMFVCLVIARCVFKSRGLDHAGHSNDGGGLLIPNIAHEMFMRSGWVYKCDWYVDPASAVMTGLVPIRVGSVARVFDIKSWTLFRLHHDTILMDDDDIRLFKIPARPPNMRGALRLGRRTLKDS